MDALKQSLAKRVASGEKRPLAKAKRTEEAAAPAPQKSSREEVAFGVSGVRMDLGHPCPESPSIPGSRSNTCRSSTATARWTGRSTPIPRTRSRPCTAPWCWGAGWTSAWCGCSGRGRIGTFAPIKGQEAAQIGSVSLLRPPDWMVPSFRETAAMLWRGWPIEKILLLFAGYLEGGQPEPDQHDLPITIPVATQIPHAVGLAYAAQYRGDDAVVMAYFGDGATSEGDFHEAMNFAGVLHVPVIFVCQNNQWAISVAAEEADALPDHRPEGARATDCPGSRSTATTSSRSTRPRAEAVERARAGDGPTLIECVTYRLGVHTTADDPTKYRSDRGSRGVGAQGPAHALQRLPGDAGPPGGGARGAGRRGDRRRRSNALRGARRPRSARDVRPRYADAPPDVSQPSAPSWPLDCATATAPAPARRHRPSPRRRRCAAAATRPPVARWPS